MNENFIVKNDIILDKPQVCQLVGLSRATIDRQVARGEFPKPLKLSIRRIGWRQSQIEAWLEERKSKA